MDGQTIVKFWTIALLFAISPGPDWACAMAAGLRVSSAVPTILGMLSGYLIIVSIIAMGVGMIIAQNATAMAVLTKSGAFYLLWLGIRALTRHSGPLNANVEPVGESTSIRFLQGVGVSALNPKGLLLLLAVLPPFVSPTGWWASLQMFVLGGIHIFNCAIVYLAVAWMAKRILQSHPLAAVITTKATGLAMLVIGLNILVSTFND